MIGWLTTAQIVIALIAGLFCLARSVARRAPDDYTIGATLLVELLLVGQFVVALLAPAFGNMPTGSLFEFWLYLGSALIIPPAAALWALVERTRWSTAVLGAACFAIAVMLYRMGQIWFVQSA